MKIKFESKNKLIFQEGGDPNVEGRDGSVPLMVCLVSLLHRDILHHFTHTMKVKCLILFWIHESITNKEKVSFNFQVCYLNCVRILCKFGANTNCTSRSNLTPLHVLNFAATENISLAREEDKAAGFEFVRNLLTLLLQHGLDPNVRFSQRSPHILLSLLDMVQNARIPSDLNYVYDLTLTLIQYGANPNINIVQQSSGSNGEDYHCKVNDEVYASQKVAAGSSFVPYQYVQYLMKKDKLWVNDPTLCFGRLIRLYYMAMNHYEVYSCLRVLYAQTGMTPTKSPICNVIREFYNKPRTLKQLSRIVVYNCCQNATAKAVAKLPLPASLREYLVNFEP